MNTFLWLCLCACSNLCFTLCLPEGSLFWQRMQTKNTLNQQQYYSSYSFVIRKAYSEASRKSKVTHIRFFFFFYWSVSSTRQQTHCNTALASRLHRVTRGTFKADSLLKSCDGRSSPQWINYTQGVIVIILEFIVNLRVYSFVMKVWF